MKSWLQPLAAWPSPKGEQFHAYIAIESQGTLDAVAQPQSKARFFPAALYFAHTGYPDTFFKDSQPNFRLSITSVDEVTNPVLKRSLANQAKVNAQPPGRINRSVEEAEGLTVMLRQLAARPEIEVKPQQVFPVSAGQVVSLQKW